MIITIIKKISISTITVVSVPNSMQSKISNLRRGVTPATPISFRSKTHHIHRMFLSAKRQCVTMAQKDDQPEWYKALEDVADLDEDYKALLERAKRNPKLVEQSMKEEMDALHESIVGSNWSGEDAPMHVDFRNADDPFNLWIWIELIKPPLSADVDMLQEILNSWFLIGRLGGYNANNLQTMNANGLSYFEYDGTEASTTLKSVMHEMTDLQAQGPWLRCKVDLGTSDELALDVLINTLSTFSREQLGIKQLVIGGENDDWPVPEPEYQNNYTMDPMQFQSFNFEDNDEEDEVEVEDILDENDEFIDDE